MTHTYKRGLVRTIVLIIVALILLGYFNINVRQVIYSPMVQENLKFVWNLIVTEAKHAWDVVSAAIKGFLESR